MRVNHVMVCEVTMQAVHILLSAEIQVFKSANNYRSHSLVIGIVCVVNILQHRGKFI